MEIDRVELADIGRPAVLAEAVLRQIGIDDGPVPVEEIAVACDITAIEEMDNVPFLGCLVALPGKSEGTIILRSGQSYTRRRFTIAHELGHFLNPWHVPNPSGQTCNENDLNGQARSLEAKSAQRHEVQANEFASALLMPKAGFIRRIGGRNPSTELLTELQLAFATSKQATSARLVQLSEIPIATVTARNGKIESFTRGREFPFIGLQIDMQVPRRSICALFEGGTGDHSSMSMVDPAVWSLRIPTGAVLYEQVQIQQGGYRTVLMWMDESGILDDDDAYAESKADEDPYFH